MNRTDIDDLFALLKFYFPNSNRLKDEKLKSAWLLVLEPYDRETVKGALANQLRESKFFPDPQSIAAKCPPAIVEGGTELDLYQPTGRDKFHLDQWSERLIRHGELIRSRRTAGIPATWGEAREAGMKAEEWAGILDSHRLSVEVIL